MILCCKPKTSLQIHYWSSTVNSIVLHQCGESVRSLLRVRRLHSFSQTPWRFSFAVQKRFVGSDQQKYPLSTGPLQAKHHGNMFSTDCLHTGSHQPDLRLCAGCTSSLHHEPCKWPTQWERLHECVSISMLFRKQAGNQKCEP